MPRQPKRKLTQSGGVLANAPEQGSGRGAPRPLDLRPSQEQAAERPQGQHHQTLPLYLKVGTPVVSQSSRGAAAAAGCHEEARMQGAMRAPVRTMRVLLVSDRKMASEDGTRGRRSWRGTAEGEADLTRGVLPCRAGAKPA